MIGIFDSGIGGLTVARAVMTRLPEHDVLYFGDSARAPYGSKSNETIRKYALQDTDFLTEKGARMVVMACNTAASVGGAHVAAHHDLPLFEVISPAVELAVKTSKTGRIGVIGTRATVASGVYERKIREALPTASVSSAACPLLVPLVEEGWLGKPETTMIVKKYLIPLKARQIDTLILGCTHYPILKEIIQRKMGKRVTLIDSAIALADRIAAYLDAHPELDAGMRRTGTFQLFVSDTTPQFETVAKMILKRKFSITRVRF